MKQILTRPTLLIWQLPITPYNTITNRTLALPLQRTIDIALKRRQRIDQTAVEDSDGAKRGAQPRLPFCFVDGDAVEAFDVCVGEGKSGRKGNAHRHGLVVDEVGGGYLAGARGDADAEGGVGVGGGGLLGPDGYGVEGGGDDGRGDLRRG